MAVIAWLCVRRFHRQQNSWALSVQSEAAQLLLCQWCSYDTFLSFELDEELLSELESSDSDELDELFLLSVQYHPEPLNMIPTLRLISLLTLLPQVGQVLSGSSVIFCSTSNLPQLGHRYSYVGTIAPSC